jgi:pimeloyl-ACP methyl ester carboxylesterase
MKKHDRKARHGARLKVTVGSILLLAGTAIGTAAMAAKAPVLPSDAAARKRTPEQQAIIAASIKEEQREMAVLGIGELRPPKNAVHPDKPDFTNYDEAKANPYPKLPDLLTLNDGTKVTTPAQWEKRRAEIKALFDENVYGKYPRHIPGVTWKVESVTQQTIDGIPAIVKHVIGHVDNSGDPAITVDIPVDVVTPASTKGHGVPVIIGGGTVHPRFDLTGASGPYLRLPGFDMCIAVGPRVEPSEQQLLERGWGFVSVDVNAVQADNGAGLDKGIIGLVNKGKPRKMDDWGVLRAWAWADSRAIDYLLTDKDVDGKKIGVMGHSRGGKAALVALVDDPRIAIGFVSSSGAGGANLYRRNYGELPENVAAANEYHWMAANFLRYAAVGHTANEMPVDSHEFIALVAPRAIFIGGGGLIMQPACAIPGDAWQDAHGMFIAEVAASPAWTLLGAQGLGTSTFPKVETFIDTGDMAFRQHPYGHTPMPNWSYFIQFAAKEFAKQH